MRVGHGAATAREWLREHRRQLFGLGAGAFVLAVEPVGERLQNGKCIDGGQRLRQRAIPRQRPQLIVDSNPLCVPLLRTRVTDRRRIVANQQTRQLGGLILFAKGRRPRRHAFSNPRRQCLAVNECRSHGSFQMGGPSLQG